MTRDSEARSDAGGEPTSGEVVGTRAALLDAAERLIAEHGIGAASVRAITQEAGANVASVHYYFGSKEALARAVYARRFGPINAERLHRLDTCEAAAGDGAPDLRCLIEAFAAPALEALRDGAGPMLAGLIGRALAEPSGEGIEVLRSAFREVFDRFLPAFRRALPDLPADELLWRFHFLVGAMAHTVQMTERAARGAGAGWRDGPQPSDADDRLLRRLTDFAEAGLRAPSALAEEAEPGAGGRGPGRRR